jgi:DNA polymerase-3 subunit gamma/tau
MSYLVLARKYRPRVFSDLVGQPHVVRPLVNALKSDRLAQAYLFAGARGVGKTTVARILAMALNCLDDRSDPPCGQCVSCSEIIEGQAVDVFEIDGASNRGINEIRELRETVRYLPGKGQFKVYIIDEVHMLTKEAFNALLKTLEEPPAHVVFIFATTEAHKVLPTILSRCQRYDFKRIGLDAIVDRLEFITRTEQVDVSPASLRLIAREADGSLRDALSLLDQVIAFAGTTVSDEAVGEGLGLIDQTLISGMVAALLAGDAGRALDILDQAYNFGHDMKDLATRIRDFLRMLVVVRVASQPAKILDLSDEELVDIEKAAAEHSLETLNFHFNAWLEVQGRLQRIGQPRLVLEGLIVRLAQVEPLVPLTELVARLETLLAATGGAAPPCPAGPGRPNPPASSGESGVLGNAAERLPAEPPARSGAAWSSFMASVQGKNPVWHSVLQQAAVREFGESRVRLVFGKKGHAALVDREMLKEMLEDFLGHRPELIIAFSEEAEAVGNDRSTAIETVRQEILDHPLIREAREIFPGEVVEVIPEK